MSGKSEMERRRQQRLARALRENLKRRKAQARRREASAEPPAEPAGGRNQANKRQ